MRGYCPACKKRKRDIMNIEKEIFEKYSYDERYLVGFADLMQSESSDSANAYIVLMPDEKVRCNNGNAKALRIKRLISCIFSFGIYQNTIRSLSLKQTMRYIRGTFLFFAIMALVALIAVLCTTGNWPMAIVSSLLVVSFCYGPIQFMTIPFERMKFYVGYNAIHPTEIWNVDKVAELSFNDFYAVFINPVRPINYYPLMYIVSLYRKFMLLKKVANCSQDIQNSHIPATLLHLSKLKKGCEVYLVTQQHEILKYSQTDSK